MVGAYKVVRSGLVAEYGLLGEYGVVPKKRASLGPSEP